MHHATRITNKLRTALECPLSLRHRLRHTTTKEKHATLRTCRVRGKGLPWEP